MNDTNFTPINIPRHNANDDMMFLVEWLASDAQAVIEGDAICTLESSKATFEFTAPCSGYLHITAPAGSDLPIGETIAWITPSPERPAHWPCDKPVAPQAHATIEGEIKITAKARILMEKHDITADAFAGVTLLRERDVLEYLSEHSAELSTDGEKLLPHSHMQLQTAKVLTKSFSTIPHSYLSKHISADKLEAAVAKICMTDDILISLSDLLVSCTAQTLRDFPNVNSTWLEAGVMLHSEISVGVALNQNDGTLVVPVIRNADTLGLAEIAGKIRGFQKRSIRNRLTVEDLTDGHFSVTSMIGTGISQVFPIIYPGQAAILAIGDRWGLNENEYQTLTMAFDHRLLNGAQAAGFLQAVCERMLQEKK